VAFRGRWNVLEVKDGSLPPSRRQLTDAEDEWHAAASQQGPVHIVEDVADALQAIGAL
jgi:hypothetical protein